MLFAVGLINFKKFSLKILRLGVFWIWGSNSFHSMMTDGKKTFSKKLYLTLKWRTLFIFLVKYGLVNVGIILKDILEIGLSKFSSLYHDLSCTACVRCSTYSSCIGWGCIILNAFYFLLKKHIICLIVDNIVKVRVWSLIIF